MSAIAPYANKPITRQEWCPFQGIRKRVGAALKEFKGTEPTTDILAPYRKQASSINKTKDWTIVQTILRLLLNPFALVAGASFATIGVFDIKSIIASIFDKQEANDIKNNALKHAFNARHLSHLACVAVGSALLAGLGTSLTIAPFFISAIIGLAFVLAFDQFRKLMGVKVGPEPVTFKNVLNNEDKEKKPIEEESKSPSPSKDKEETPSPKPKEETPPPTQSPSPEEKPPINQSAGKSNKLPEAGVAQDDKKNNKQDVKKEGAGSPGNIPNSLNPSIYPTVQTWQPSPDAKNNIVPAGGLTLVFNQSLAPQNITRQG
jgi:hypothetical protein